jgi:hypothetical protein
VTSVRSQPTPLVDIEPKPAPDQAARLRAFRDAHAAAGGPALVLRGAKGGVGVTTIAGELRPALAPRQIDVIDAGAGPAHPGSGVETLVLVVTPQPCVLAAAFDALRTLHDPAHPDPTPALLLVNRTHSSERAAAVAHRLDAALRAVNLPGTLFAGCIPDDPVLARPVERRGWVGAWRPALSRAQWACRALADRLADFVSPDAPAGTGGPVGAGA